MIVVNLAKHHTRAFHEIEHIEWPFMILFFFLAGASLHTDRWWEFGLIAGAFLVLRTISRIAGGWVGGKLGAAPDNHRRWMGVALLPQAGVAVGMALVAGDHFPDLREVILTVTIGTTVVFEIFGPIATRVALDKAEESEGPLP
jgi:Kef-type K+ transport system membrane component KefB